MSIEIYRDIYIDALRGMQVSLRAWRVLVELGLALEVPDSDGMTYEWSYEALSFGDRTLLELQLLYRFIKELK